MGELQNVKENWNCSNIKNTTYSEESFPIKLRVSSFNNENDIKLIVSPNQTVKELKKQLKDVIHTDDFNVRIYFGGKCLKEKDKLCSHNVRKNVVIQVVVN